MDYCRLPVTDTRRSASLYADLLGVTAQLHPKGDYAEIETPDILIALYGPDFESYDRRTPELDRPLQTVRLPPLPAPHVQQVLRDHGLRVEPSTAEPFLDPDGHTVIWTATESLVTSI